METALKNEMERKISILYPNRIRALFVLLPAAHLHSSCMSSRGCALRLKMLDYMFPFAWHVLAQGPPSDTILC